MADARARNVRRTTLLTEAEERHEFLQSLRLLLLGLRGRGRLFHQRRGLLRGRQLAKGQPWQITLPDEQIRMLRAQVRRTNRSK